MTCVMVSDGQWLSVSTIVIKLSDQKQLEGELSFIIFHLRLLGNSPSVREIRAGTQEREESGDRS